MNGQTDRIWTIAISRNSKKRYKMIKKKGGDKRSGKNNDREIPLGKLTHICIVDAVREENPAQRARE
jgi:hypothetical protein